MTVEHASVEVARKPWGVTELRPWSSINISGDRVGELRFRRAGENAPIPALLFKLLFTGEPLSIQVHPDDKFAHSIGLPNGKTEAWYILAATPDARVAVGLIRQLTRPQLRESIRDGSIATLTQWRPVTKGDIIFIPAGTIHAIGAGIVLAEIQQHSDTTFRLFDYGRQRELHEENAVAVSDAGPAQSQAGPRRLTANRTALIVSPHFILERIDLKANSRWTLNVDQQTWIFVIEGHAGIGSIGASIGDAFFAEADQIRIEAGRDGMIGLIAYPGPSPNEVLLQASREQMTTPGRIPAARAPKSNQIVEVQT